jgi:hypothetical protein
MILKSSNIIKKLFDPEVMRDLVDVGKTWVKILIVVRKKSCA